jgi:hypothetical protein
MIAEEYLGRSRLFRRLKSGPDGQLVVVFAARLAQEGLARHGTWRCLNLVGDLLSWIAGDRSKLTDLDERMVERYLRYRGGKQSIQPGDRAALKRWLSVLRDAGSIAPAALRPMTSQDQIFEEFGDYLRRERGLAPKSIVRHQPFIRRFLREVCPAGVGDLGRINQRKSSATSSATLGIGARDPGRRCAGRCVHFCDISIIVGSTRSLWPAACPRSGNGSSRVCRPISRLRRFRRSSMVVTAQPP